MWARLSSTGAAISQPWSSSRLLFRYILIHCYNSQFYKMNLHFCLQCSISLNVKKNLVTLASQPDSTHCNVINYDAARISKQPASKFNMVNTP